MEEIKERKRPIYPNVLSKGTLLGNISEAHPADLVMGRCSYELYLETYVRKWHDGHYYLIKVVGRYTLKNESLSAYAETVEAMNQFHGEVYRFLMLSVVDPKLMSDRDGTVVFEKDEDTTSEPVRLLRHQYPLRPDECYPRYKTDAEIALEKMQMMKKEEDGKKK